MPVRPAADNESTGTGDALDGPSADQVEEADPDQSTEPEEVTSGQAGASARREYERRRAKDEAKIRARWGKLGGIAVALSDERQSTEAWKKGAVGEERLGERLDGAASPTFVVLHDRRIPGTRRNIDHIVITTQGVHVVDAKRYSGKVERRRSEGILRAPVEQLFVGGNDRTKLVHKLHEQMDLVRDVVGPEVPVFGALCFVNADWPLVGGDVTIDGVRVLWPKRLVKDLKNANDGPHDVDMIRDLIVGHFPEA